MTAKDIVLTAAGQLFGDKDPSAVDRWVAPTYVQHSSLATDGAEGLRQLVATLPEGFSYDLHRVVADGDLVALHLHSQESPDDPGRAIVDIFRVENGKIVEHFDVIQSVPATTANGNTMFQGDKAD